MNNRLWYTDGLSRKRYEEQRDVVPDLNMLEYEYPVLMARVIEMMNHICFYNIENKRAGVLGALFFYQPLIVLGEIEQVDTAAREKEFKDAYKAGNKRCGVLKKELKKELDDWDRRMSYYRDLSLMLSLRNRPVVSEEDVDNEIIKKEFYSLLETVRKCQRNHDAYLEDIQECGKNDPALAVVNVFLHNYGQVAKRFNDRWREFPSFYVEQMLHASCRKPEPDRTWLVLTKGADDREVTVPRDTRFVAGKNADTTLFCYRSEKDLVVGDAEAVRVNTYLLEKDDRKYPAHDLEYVTAVLEKAMDLTDMKPQILFGGIDSWHEPVGLLVESPMFILREGNRRVVITFRLTHKSVNFFSNLIEQIKNQRGQSEDEIIYKLLFDAFYLEISTEEEWRNVPDYMLTYEHEKEIHFFQLTFQLDELFPAPGKCSREKHDRDSEVPVLRILMNREAWLFPYSWAKQIEFDKMSIKTEVTGISALKLYGMGGEMDPSAPDCPFGSQPERGAWFVFGNYEMALKPLTKFGLICHWQQLPLNPEGFYGYYKGYNAGIDNHSFKVRTEWLSGRKWFSAPDSSYLFKPADGTPLLKAGRLPESSLIDCEITERILPVDVQEEQYTYGTTRSGFMRVVLDGPEVGFGHTLYRQLFTDTVIRNSRGKGALPLPVEPVTPLVGNWTLNYVAEETIDLFLEQNVSKTKLYYVNPLVKAIFPVTTPDLLKLADGPADDACLLLGFRKVLSADRLRFFVDMMPWQQEIDEGWIGSNGTWLFNNGRQWQRLDADCVLEDTTRFFVNSGIIEVLLPAPIVAEWLDSEGIFWLCATFTAEMIHRPALKGIYMNAVEVVSDVDHILEHPESIAGLPPETITQSESDLPGIKKIWQAVAGKGGHVEGDAANLRLRISGRIAGRGRVVLPADYERSVLERFPLAMKVKCLPGLSRKEYWTRNTVTLVVVPRPTGQRWPLSTAQLLADVEDWLKGLTDCLVHVDAINPVYEEMTVHCQVMLSKDRPQGEILRRLEGKLNDQIAPWIHTDMIPVFGYRFSMQSLRNVILQDPGVEKLVGLSVLHVTEQGKRIYRLDEYGVGENEDGLIGASQPWCVAVPASRHLLKVGNGQPWNETGLDDLEIGKTLVLG